MAEIMAQQDAVGGKVRVHQIGGIHHDLRAIFEVIEPRLAVDMARIKRPLALGDAADSTAVCVSIPPQQNIAEAFLCGAVRHSRGRWR